MQRISRPHTYITAGIALVMLSLVSCGDGKKAEPTLAASQLCDSTLGTSAAADLEHMAGTEKFTELPGTNDFGKPNKFSLKQSADTLHNDMTQRNQCVVFKSGDTTGHPLISVDFSAVKQHPTTTTGTSEGSDLSTYQMGVYSATHGTASASLYFKCSSRNPDQSPQSTPYVEAELVGTPDQLSGKSTGHNSMTVLNAVSRAMAKQLGCASQASLPSRVPAAQTN
ncbi:hypothetical protein [Streptomyces sp. NPDC056634]|uniref:hypothetical protein n=1 Tax=Streptomyces sp. NPDC056634 TaxID=3345885 RepID=UPI0036D12C8B